MSRFVSFLALGLIYFGIGVFSLCIRAESIFIVIAAVSFIAAVCNILGIILPYCCKDFSHIYDNPVSKSKKLKVKHFQVEEPFVENDYPVPQEVIRDSISESIASIDNNNKNQKHDNNENKSDYNLI